MSIVTDKFFDEFEVDSAFLIDQEWFETFMYQGFNPAIIKKELIKQKWKKDEIVKIIVFFLVRGTSLKEKAMNNSSEDCTDFINTLKNKGLEQRPSKSNTITINRIVASLPDMVAILLAKNLDLCRIVAIEATNEIPDYLKFSAGASLCLDEEELNNWIIWATEQDKIINQNPDASRVENFARIQYNSNTLPILKRRAVREKIDAEY